MDKLIFIILMALPLWVYPQGIAITVDDVPNKQLQENGEPALLKIFQQKNVPVAIFINEKPIYNRESLSFLEHWISDTLVTVGNHTYSHRRYSAVGLQNYVNEIVMGEKFTRTMAEDYDKELKYFRPPYNDLGDNARAHEQLQYVLDTMGYLMTPYTVESSDWLYNAIYKARLSDNDVEGAWEIGQMYVAQTMKVLNYIEGILKAVQQRPVNHIYLCHDNEINRAFLPEIIDKFRNSGYQLISLEEALCDPMYLQPDHYTGKWGISWAYRWILDELTRKQVMQNEPHDTRAQFFYEQLGN